MSYKKLLSAWHRIEHYSPAAVPKSNDVEELKEARWLTPLISEDKKKEYVHTLYLGVFNSIHVDNYVANYFDAKDEKINKQNAQICTASLKLNEKGDFLSGSFGLASLPWALSQLEEHFEKDDWAKKFDLLKSDIEDYIEQDFPKKPTIDDLKKLEQIIKMYCKWDGFPDTKICIQSKLEFKKKNDEDKTTSEIINSFYIEDLEKLISISKDVIPNSGFQKYLQAGLNIPITQNDLGDNKEEIKETTSLKNLPLGCWPSKYTLSLMQQYAVNKSMELLSKPDAKGIYSVNGPPGTGKTTLLRDIIATLMVQRTQSLIDFDNPADAFDYVRSVDVSENYKFSVYAPCKKISGFGMVIASSNNGAVENISKELPLLNEVGDYAHDINYFKEVTQKCISEEYWGLISAVLGNKQNRSDFVDKLWFNDEADTNLRTFLKENKRSTNEEWNDVKKRFRNKLEEVNIEKERLLNTEKLVYSLNKEKKVLEDLTLLLKEQETQLKEFAEKKQSLEKEAGSCRQRKDELQNDLQFIKNNKPGFFAWLFSAKRRKEYQNKINKVENEYLSVCDLLKELLTQLEKTTKSISETKKTFKDTQIKHQKQKSKYENILLLRDEIKEELKANFADEEFWQNINSKKSQAACPWYSEDLKKLQSELFVLAMEVHEEFLLRANNSKGMIGLTLSVFLEYLKTGSMAAKEVSKEEAKSLWDMFFLIVPVVSTTFASFSRMFNDLKEEELPWLFIDEAGQAVPQAAAGAIWRAQKTMVVGDPQQIEPVVTVSSLITDNIRKHFDLKKDQISTDLSVQSLADRANPFGRYLEVNNQNIWIGTPLRIHRRCVEPMFTIANEIAYNSSMYNCTVPNNEGESKLQTNFIHCVGSVSGRHYVQEQAEIVKNLIIKEIHHTQQLPDLFVISPFSEIPWEFRKFVAYSILQAIKQYLQGVEMEDIFEWLNKKVGTVHTFQGKQASTVIMLLGIDNSTKGAAQWAGSKPNLLNVALTRAKHRFIAVGDKELWTSIPYFNRLSLLGGIDV